MRGDIDKLGMESVQAVAWLRFDGISVHLPEAPPDVEAARAELGRFTDATGLRGERTRHICRFSPA